MKIIQKAMIALIALLLITGCSKSLKDAGNYADDYPESFMKPSSTSSVNSPSYLKSEDSTASYQGQQEQKIIINSSVTLETDDLDKLIGFLNGQLNAYGGYTADSHIENQYRGYSRYATIKVRVPYEHFEQFTQATSQMGNILSSQISSDDITEQYYDLQSRIDSLTAERERVMQFYEKATSISELLQIEQRLSEIDSEIASRTVTMKNYQLLTSYSTITYTVYEVASYTETTDTFLSRLGVQIRNSFTDFLAFLEDALFWLIDKFWYLLMIIGAVMILRKVNVNTGFLRKINPFKKRTGKTEDSQNS